MMPGSSHLKEKESCTIIGLMIAVTLILTVLVVAQGRQMAALSNEKHSPNYMVSQQFSSTSEQDTPTIKDKEPEETPEPLPHRPVYKGMEIDIPLIDGVHLVS
jgi:cytoskeletal protein RodZ